jgi:hypothetical protein
MLSENNKFKTILQIEPLKAAIEEFENLYLGTHPSKE